jgi:hypothetical protein
MYHFFLFLICWWIVAQGWRVASNKMLDRSMPSEESFAMQLVTFLLYHAPVRLQNIPCFGNQILIWNFWTQHLLQCSYFINICHFFLHSRFSRFYWSHSTALHSLYSRLLHRFMHSFKLSHSLFPIRSLYSACFALATFLWFSFFLIFWSLHFAQCFFSVPLLLWLV